VDRPKAKPFDPAHNSNDLQIFQSGESKMKTKTWKRLTVTAATLVLALVMAVTAFASGTVTYTGQGFTFDGTTWTLNSQRCGLEGQGIANDGGTGQFANDPQFAGWQPGDPYLVWVLTVNGATSATLQGGPFGAGVSMYQVGGTYKYASQYYSPDQLINIVSAMWTGGKGKATLTVSHGCPPRTGGWCSPGFWRNAADGAWQAAGYASAAAGKADTWANTLDNDANWVGSSLANTTLGTILNDPQTYSGPPIGTYDGVSMNAFNAVGAHLTNQLTGGFDPAQFLPNGTCQIDHFGNYVP
jgi:hypothetical protein